MSDPDVTLSRELAVEAVLNSPGQCQVTTKLQAPSPFATKIATGTMFAVTAKQDIEILSFEFAHFDYSEDLEVEIYTLAGKNYQASRSTPSDWTKLSQAITVDSPDQNDENINIAPRGAMTSSVSIKAGDSQSFYFTLRSQHLKLEESSTGKPLTTGQVYFSDNFLSADVGIGIRVGGFPNTPDDANRGFQGRIHYRAIQSCSELLGQTQTVVRTVVPTAAVPQSANDAFRTAFTNLLQTRVDWARWITTDGLKLNSVQASVAENKNDCSEHGVTGSCTVYDNKLTMVHYASLPGKEVELEVVKSMVESNNTVTISGDSKMTYIGPRVLSRYYRLQLFGVASGTILTPVQRDYIATVTLDFLRSNSESIPNSVEVISQDFSRRMMTESELRGGGRQLQSVVTAESFIYGLGNDAQAFYEPIENFFRVNESDYRKFLQVEQYRPGAINDGEDFGVIFKDLFRVSVRTNETVVDAAGSTDDEGNTTWVIIWSILLALSILFLCYRIAKDFFLETDGHRIKKGEKVSDRKLRRKQEGTDGDNEGGNYMYGGRDGRDRAKTKKNPNKRGGPPNGKKKRRPPGAPSSKQSLNSNSGHSAGQRKRSPKPPIRRPNSPPSSYRSDDSNGPPARKKPGKKKKRPPQRQVT